METTLIKSNHQKNKALKIIMIAAIAVIIIGLILSVITYVTGEHFSRGHTSSYVNPFSGELLGTKDKYEPYNEYYDSFIPFFTETFFEEAYGYVIIAGVLVAVVYIVLFLKMNTSEITVTSMRIIGKSNYGKQVDLPLAQISTMAKCKFSGIAISTSSGKKSFWLIENREDVYNTISRAMADTQSKSKESNSVPVSNADDLKKFKELLDAGVISQEEFDIKKKQLLGV